MQTGEAIPGKLEQTVAPVEGFPLSSSFCKGEGKNDFPAARTD
jgi:hypothetical protein